MDTYKNLVVLERWTGASTSTCGILINAKLVGMLPKRNSVADRANSMYYRRHALAEREMNQTFRRSNHDNSFQSPRLLGSLI